MEFLAEPIGNAFRTIFMKGSEELVMATQSTREHLIDVGLGLMHQNGYNATGLADILKAADVPKGSFYHHFGSKEEFAAAALERYGMRERAHAAAVLGDATVSPLERLRRYFSDLLKFYGQQGPIPGCMMGRFSLEIAAESSQLRRRISASFEHWQQAIATVIREAVAKKELSADTDAKSLAGFLLNNWEGALLRSQADKSNAPLETFMRYVFDGLLKNESSGSKPVRNEAARGEAKGGASSARLSTRRRKNMAV
jgi:TetR/AcrR family transcriptional regulator, transcriptional repressor for nem operon